MYVEMYQETDKSLYVVVALRLCNARLIFFPRVFIYSFRTFLIKFAPLINLGNKNVHIYIVYACTRYSRRKTLS